MAGAFADRRLRSGRSDESEELHSVHPVDAVRDVDARILKNGVFRGHVQDE
jgi:hypothetical protein